MLTITPSRALEVAVWSRRLRRLQLVDLDVHDLLGLPVPAPNLALLRKVLDRVDAHPDEWRQGSWNACIVGMAMHEAGVNAPDDTGAESAWLRLGAITLGLLPVEVEWLADGENDRIDLDTIARAIAQRAGETL